VEYRTGLIEFALDQLDFIESKLNEACTDPASQKAAATEAGGAIPQLKERLRAEDPTKYAQCAFLGDVFDNDRWSNLATMEREQFLAEAASTNRAIAAARTVLAEPTSAE